MNISRNSLYINPFTKAFIGMRYATKAELDEVPYIVYQRQQDEDHYSCKYMLLINDTEIDFRIDGLGNKALEIMGWKITEEALYGNGTRKMGYSIPDTHFSCERVSLYQSDEISFHYKNIAVENTGLTIEQFKDKISPYITLAYTEAALDKLG